jgi:hypothetical protein
MKVGQCFSFKFSEDNVKGYFFTGEFDNEGKMIMCEMLPKEEIDFTSFWRMSKIYFDNKVKEGIIKLIN